MTDRDRGVLTEADREYLRGEKELSEGSEFNTKRRIRRRVKNALLDFSILFDHLDQEERRKIFTSAEEEREPFIEALSAFFAFVYRETYPTTHIPSFKYFLKEGIRRAERDMAGTDLHEVDVKFDVTPISINSIDLDDVAHKVRFGKWEELSEVEMRHFLKVAQYVEGFSPDDVPQAFRERHEALLEEANEGMAKRQKELREKQRPGADSTTSQTTDNNGTE